MKILIYGAGVLGSLYAAELQAAGQDVTLLARGERLRQLEDHGILLQDVSKGSRTLTRVRLTDELKPEDAYDWVIVLVRRTQLDSVLPDLAAHQRTPNVLLMLNNASGFEQISELLGRERAALGFPGAGGMRLGPVVSYSLVPGWLQPTTLGELDGQVSPRLVEIGTILKSAGFPTAISTDMDAWLKTHAAWVTPIANAIYLAGGSVHRLSRTPDGLVMMVRAIRENLRALRALGIPITPALLNYWRWVPEPLLVLSARRLFRTLFAETVLQRHAVAARDEMCLLSEEIDALVQTSGRSAPHAAELRAYLSPEEPLVAEGSAQIKMNFRELAAAFGITAAVVGLIWLAGRKRK